MIGNRNKTVKMILEQYDRLEIPGHGSIPPWGVVYKKKTIPNTKRPHSRTFTPYAITGGGILLISIIISVYLGIKT